MYDFDENTYNNYSDEQNTNNQNEEDTYESELWQPLEGEEESQQYS